MSYIRFSKMTQSTCPFRINWPDAKWQDFCTTSKIDPVIFLPCQEFRWKHWRYAFINLVHDVIWHVFVYIWMVEELWIYLICTAKFLTFLDGGGILDLFFLTLKYLTFLVSGGILDVFWLYCIIPDSSGCWRNFGSILFVLQNPWHFWIYTLKISWLFTFSKSADCLHFQISWLLSFKK